MKVLEVKAAGFRRNGSQILSNVSWTVEDGEHWALLGANGSGKTTLLKLVTGYDWASEGTIEVLGNRFGECHIPRLRRIIGWVSSSIQERLPSGDSALRIVASGYDASLGVYRALGDAEMARAGEALELLGCRELASRTYGTLSQGERQRVLIARAMVNRPKLLILDEPCAGLDPLSSRLFLGRSCQPGGASRLACHRARHTPRGGNRAVGEQGAGHEERSCSRAGHERRHPDRRGPQRSLRVSMPRRV